MRGEQEGRAGGAGYKRGLERVVGDPEGGLRAATHQHRPTKETGSRLDAHPTIRVVHACEDPGKILCSRARRNTERRLGHQHLKPKETSQLATPMVRRAGNLLEPQLERGLSACHPSGTALDVLWRERWGAPCLPRCTLTQLGMKLLEISVPELGLGCTGVGG